MKRRLLSTYLSNIKGLSLIELVVVLAIAVILMVAGGISIKPILNKRRVRICGSEMVDNIRLLRSSAQSNGCRAIFQLSDTGKSKDIDGDGSKEYYMGYLDKDGDGSFTAGDKALIKGTAGDELCSSVVSIDNDTLSPAHKIIFDPLGFVMSGAANRNIYIKADDTAVRIELVSLAGMMRTYINNDNCGGNTCDTADSWEELQ